MILEEEQFLYDTVEMISIYKAENIDISCAIYFPFYWCIRGFLFDMMMYNIDDV